MYKKTFETIAKYFATASKVSLVFDTDGGAYADMKADMLHLPKAIADENAYAALALTMHEAAHIRYSKKIPMEDLVDTEADKFILNAIEDVRIDRKNFGVLPNIKEFYRQLVKDHTNLTKVKDKIVAMLCKAILKLEGFKTTPRKDVDKAKQKNLEELMKEGIFNIDYNKWDDFKQTRDSIKKLLGINPDKDRKLPKEEKCIGVAGGKGKDGEGTIQAQIDGITKNNACLKPGQQDMEGGSGQFGSPIALEEQTTKQFKEILNIKETRVSENGKELDTDSLISYFTHDIAELFKEEKIVKKKKSKIFLLLDGSGSMNQRLLDHTPDYQIVSASVKSLTNILDELRETEGVDIDWDIGMFRSTYHPLTKENWQQRYSPAGGTMLEGPFISVVEDMLKDYTIEGKRIIVVLTDGEIYESEIENVQQYLISKAKDIRPIFIGVGLNYSKNKFTKDLLGDNVILDKSSADFIICKAIETLL